MTAQRTAFSAGLPGTPRHNRAKSNYCRLAAKALAIGQLASSEFFAVAAVGNIILQVYTLRRQSPREKNTRF